MPSARIVDDFKGIWEENAMGCYNSCVVNAPVANVWAVLRDFHDLTWAPDVVHSVDRVGSALGTEVGARRILNGVFRETLLALDDAGHQLSYSIDDGPGPVSAANVDGYVGTVRVLPVTDRNEAFVEWSSSWEDSKGGVQEFCDPIYRALLDAMKRHFEEAQ